MPRWWDRYPERFEWELEALRLAGIPFNLDQDALVAGIARLTVTVTIDGEQHELLVTFPDLYPYFRFEVRAPNLTLDHHQNPFTRQLCVLGRASETWDTSDSVASILVEQVAKVIAANRADAAGDEFAEEERQAEPASEYFPYVPHSIVLVDGAWKIEHSVKSGKMTLGFNELDDKQRPAKLLRCAVLRVQSDSGEELARADSRVVSRYPWTHTARWVRAEKLPLLADAGAFFEAAQALDPRHKNNGPIPVEGGELRVVGVLFPEETGYRQIGEGWLFAVEFLGQRTKKRQEHGYYFARPVRGGPSDFLDRAPELRSLQEERIAVFGLGCLGAPSALEFARSGIGEIALLDGDHVEFSTAVRWPFGLGYAGRLKAQTLALAIEEHYPYTRVEWLNHQLGGTRHSADRERSDEEAMSIMLERTSLIYDASADAGLQYYLADTARQRNIPYVGVAGKQGGWGGYVVRLVPGVTEGCWMCLQHLWGEHFPLPSAASTPFIQPVGCGSPTFLAAGFDMTQLALHGVRMAVSVLTSGSDPRYPEGDWDLLVWSTRDANGAPIPPTAAVHQLPRYSGCSVCGVK